MYAHVNSSKFTGCVTELPGYVDLDLLMTTPFVGEKWIVEGILAEDRLTALVGEAKIGKSLLALEIAVAVSLGKPVLGRPTRKTKVLYIDMENNIETDVKSRLLEFGYKPGNFENLIYLWYPILEPFDTAAGGAQLAQIVKAHDIKLVIIDTVSRVVNGDENSNDTWNAFYRLFELPMKQARVAVLRIDHVGKDHSKGARGASAKSGDVDLVIRMTADRTGRIFLRRDAARMHGGFEHLALKRETTPTLHHKVTENTRGLSAELHAQQLADLLDSTGTPRGLTNDETRAALGALGERCAKKVSEIVTKMRKEEPSISPRSKSETFDEGSDPSNDAGSTWGWWSPTASGISPNVFRPRQKCWK